MKRNWHPDELAQHWTILLDERPLLDKKVGATKLLFAVLLKSFQRDGRFPRHAEDVPDSCISHLAHQLDMPPNAFLKVDWQGRTIKAQRAQIREHLGFRQATVQDAEVLAEWLSERLASHDPDAEALRSAAYARLRESHLEPPTEDRLRRLLSSAVRRFETRLYAMTCAQLSAKTREGLDVLISTDADQGEDDAQVALFPVRSELATLKDDAGSVKAETVMEEIKKLRQLRALNLPPHLFRDVPDKLLTHYRQRAARSPPRELRRHPPEVRYTLLAALCWQRSREVTDSLVDLLLHIAHRIGVRAEEKVNDVLMRHLKKVVGKNKLLYKLAKVSKQSPDSTVREVIFPAVGEPVLDALIEEAEAESSYERQVRLVTRNSYGHHYRRIVPALLEILAFGCNNELHRPIMNALSLLEKYQGRKTAVFPAKENVPLDGVVKDDWQDLVLDEGGHVNRISYELCVLTTLREKVRCKEVWVKEAWRFRNPDEDLPQDFDARRDEYYEALAQPREAKTFTHSVRQTMEVVLEAFDTDLPKNPKVTMLLSKKGKGWLKVTPLNKQPEPPNLVKLTAAIVKLWPMTNLLDILKETELRVGFSEAFRTVGQREILAPEVLQRRLLLALHGLGTNAGLNRVSSGGTQDSYSDLQYVKRRYITTRQLRQAISRVCNAILSERQTNIWGEATTACASDSKKFGAWDQNLMTEWHVRYGGPGVMVYWHVEENSVCIYSQLKSCSSSEVAAMIEGVLRHETAMEVDQTYVDTHGQSHVGFAFCHLLGFKLLPRLKNIRKQKLYRPSKGEPERYPNLQPILMRPINWEIIEQQYDELVKFATALRLGTADTESILRRFTQANVQHPTYKALAELGRALKTIFLCDYLRLEKLRREIHEGLNVIETWNSANNFILYGKGSEFATNRREDQELLMLSLHLLQVCLVYVNTLMIQQVLAEPEWKDRLTAADLRGLSPLLWQHINPYGTFKLDMSERLPLKVA
ncbi:MAG: Tn3 family transposase [Deinococcota bacterium]|nr:Tn3 family transposase [Deinococcota bacterium]